MDFTYGNLTFDSESRLRAECITPTGHVDRYQFTLADLAEEDAQAEVPNFTPDFTDDGIPLLGGRLHADRLTVISDDEYSINLTAVDAKPIRDLQSGDVIIFDSEHSDLTAEVQVESIEFLDFLGNFGFRTHDDFFLAIATKGASERYLGVLVTA